MFDSFVYWINGCQCGIFKSPRQNILYSIIKPIILYIQYKQLLKSIVNQH